MKYFPHFMTLIKNTLIDDEYFFGSIIGFILITLLEKMIGEKNFRRKLSKIYLAR